MLAKCANPPCFASFRRLEWGTLFRLESDLVGSQSRLTTPEYYWLCPVCSQEMTLRIDRKNGVKVVRHRDKAPGENESPRFVPLDRHDGLLLNGVKFASQDGRRHRRVSEGRGNPNMNDDMIFEGELLAAGTTCPFPDCGALVIAYRPAMVEASNPNGLWEFTCPCCGTEFATNDDLLFHSVPEEWLTAGFHSSSMARGRSVRNHISDGDKHDEIYFES